MILVVISPERDDPREHDVLPALLRAGLARYHVRKPCASVAELAAWIQRVPAEFRSYLVLHQHHELVERFSLGGRHWRDEAATLASSSAPVASSGRRDHGGLPPSRIGADAGAAGRAGFTSRSCHDLATLRRALGRFDAVFYGPVFASLSKPGYGPEDAQVGESVGALLASRTEAERRTAVIALGGITAETAPRALALGFDGVAALGAIWQAPDPLAAFLSLRKAVDPAPDRARAGAVR